MKLGPLKIGRVHWMYSSKGPAGIDSLKSTLPIARGPDFIFSSIFKADSFYNFGWTERRILEKENISTSI